MKIEMQDKKVIIDGVSYIPESEALSKATSVDGMDYAIVRTYSAGVFAGYIESRKGKEVVMRKARCLWYWDGAASLMQLASTGTTKPSNCKFTVAVDKIELTEAIEILECTEAAQKSILGVSVWLVK